MSSDSTIESSEALSPAYIREVFSKSTCLYSKDEVEAALDAMAEEMNRTLSDSNPVFLCVVIGAIVPLGLLLPRLDFPLEVDYVHATRYRNDTVGKNLEWRAKPRVDLAGRHVVVLDDILDGGITLAEVVAFCKERGAKAVQTAVLVDKHEARLPEGLPHADFCGLKVENQYVIGYGLDYKGYLRNAPGIYRVAPEHQ